MEKHNDTILHFNKISKAFTAVKALTDIEFGIRKGEVHALIGENGAGKSTLLNIMQGIIRPDEGEIYYKDSPVEIKNPSMASKLGINMVHQELNLVQELTVGQNIFMGCEPTAVGGLIKWKEMYKKCDEILKTLECNIKGKEYVKNLSTAQMQMVEIAKALMHNSSVLALDEPTASLSNNETRKLFEIIAKLKNEGTSIIYVSHRLEEIFEIADRVTVLRDGQYIGTYNIKDIDKPTLIRLMVGRDISEYVQHTDNYSNEEKVMEVKNLTSRNKFQNISFHLKKGEILGIAGLVGAGRTELIRGIFGADKIDEGEIYLHGKKVKIKSPSSAIKHSIALIPEERKLQGMIGILPNTTNICLSSLDKYSNLGVINHKKKLNNAKHYISALKVSPPKADTPTKNLSGGNQQKVVLAKWLSLNSKILIFDEPTRGIDVGAKAEIYKLMDELVKDGNSIIMISSDLPEIIGMSDRILVMHEGKLMAELNREEANEVTILHHAMGVN